MARTRSIHRRATAAAALAVFCFGFTAMPDAAQQGLERAGEVNGHETGGSSVSTQGYSWK